MRFYYFIILLLFINTFIVKSQVGINTQSPQGVFHVDPQGDTSGTNSNSDDFIISSAGRVGIGTINPTAGLDLIGDLRITDGTEYNRSVMTSDENGIASWSRQTYTSRVVGGLPDNLPDIKSGSLALTDSWTYTGANITLPAGTWMIYFCCMYRNLSHAVNFTIWWDLCTTNYWTTARVGRVLSYFAPTTGLSATYASYRISPTETTTYYIHGCVSKVASYTFAYHSGARIWAIPVF